MLHKLTNPMLPAPRISSPLFTIDFSFPLRARLLIVCCRRSRKFKKKKKKKGLLRYCALRNAENDGCPVEVCGGVPPLPGIARGGGAQTVGIGSSNPG